MGTYNRCAKKSIKNSQPFVKKMKNVRTTQGGIFLTHTVYYKIYSAYCQCLPMLLILKAYFFELGVHLIFSIKAPCVFMHLLICLHFVDWV